MKTVNNFDNYEVHSDGKVFSKIRKIFLKPDTTEVGYQRVSLCREGVVTRVLVHRLVAEHYHPNPEGKKYVNHIDNDPSNNHKDNLEWCTHSENMIHSHIQGRCSNVVASNKAKELMDIKMTAKARKALGDKFIKYWTEDKRGKVSFNCTCGEEVVIRIDSILLLKGTCNSCSRKKKI